MTIPKRAYPTALALIALIPFLGAAERAVSLTVRVFKVPLEQAWDVEIPAGTFPAVQLTCRGEATAAFPDGILFLTTELAANADEAAVSQAVQNRVLFGNAGFPARKVSIREMKKWEPILTSRTPNAATEYQFEKTAGGWDSYGLKAGLASAEGPDLSLKIQFDAGTHWQAGSLGGGLSRTLLSETILIPASRKSKLLLVGFPSRDRGRRGDVYWLAVSVDDSPTAEPFQEGVRRDPL